MRARPAIDPLAMWRGIDDAVWREAAAAPGPALVPQMAAEAMPVTAAAQRPARLLETA